MMFTGHDKLMRVIFSLALMTVLLAQIIVARNKIAMQFKASRRTNFVFGRSFFSNMATFKCLSDFTARHAPPHTDHNKMVMLISSAQLNEALNAYLAMTCIKQIATKAIKQSPIR